MQGYEKKILDGAKQVLKKMKGVGMESSLVPLYEGERLLLEIMTFMKDKGFILTAIEPGFSDADTGRLLQADVLYFR